MKTKLNNWDAFKAHMEQIFFENVLTTLTKEQIDFYWNEFINA